MFAMLDNVESWTCIRVISVTVDNRPSKCLGTLGMNGRLNLKLPLKGFQFRRFKTDQILYFTLYSVAFDLYIINLDNKHSKYFLG